MERRTKVKRNADRYFIFLEIINFISNIFTDQILILDKFNVMGRVIKKLF